jgi:hypothetical protein
VSDDDGYLPAEFTVATMLGGDIDGLLIPCPVCGNQLRGDVRTQWRTLAEASELMGGTVTAEMVLGAGGKIDAFGRVKAAVPWVSCLHCGFDADGSITGFVNDPASLSSRDTTP